MVLERIFPARERNVQERCMKEKKYKFEQVKRTQVAFINISLLCPLQCKNEVKLFNYTHRYPLFAFQASINRNKLIVQMLYNSRSRSRMIHLVFWDNKSRREYFKKSGKIISNKIKFSSLKLFFESSEKSSAVETLFEQIVIFMNTKWEHLLLLSWLRESIKILGWQQFASNNFQFDIRVACLGEVLRRFLREHFLKKKVMQLWEFWRIKVRIGKTVIGKTVLWKMCLQ